MKLFLIRASEENGEESITKKVNISTIEENQLLTEYQIGALKESLRGFKEFNCWALTKNSQFIFESMERGDMVLFAVNKTGAFKFIGEIFYTANYGEELGKFLWRYNPNKKSWTHLYFIRNIKEISEIDKRTLLNDLGYRDEKDILQGARSIDSLNFKNLLEKEGYEEIKDYADMIELNK